MTKYFNNIPDPYVAEVLNEAMQPNAYNYVSLTRDPEFTAADGFPPEPSYIKGLAATMLSPDGNGIIHLSFQLPGGKHTPTTAQTVDAYANTLGPLQKQAKIIEPWINKDDLDSYYSRYGKLGSWCINQTIRANKRLLAAFILEMAEQNGRIHAALAYPVEFMDTFPPLIREHVSPLPDISETAGSDAVSLPSDEKLHYLATMLNSKEGISEIAAIPSSAVMPNPASYGMVLRKHRKPPRK